MASAVDLRVSTIISRLTSHCTVIISNPTTLSSKLTSILTTCSTSSPSIGVILDFDRTITTGDSLSSHGVVERCEIDGFNLKERTKVNSDKYYPIETDPTIPLSTKIPKMVEWYTLNHSIMSTAGITKSHISHVIGTSDELVLRDGSVGFLNYLCDVDVPVTVFSAGLKNVIDIILTHNNVTVNGVGEGIERKGLDVVGNKMIWDVSGELVGFVDPVIHMFNKNMSVVPEEFGIRECENVVLVGDGTGDAKMADCKADWKDGDETIFKHVVKVGFANYNTEEKTERYSEIFDVVVDGKEGMGCVEEFIRGIRGDFDER